MSDITWWSRRNRRVTLRWFFVLLTYAALTFIYAPYAHADATAWVDADDNVAIMQRFVDTVGMITDKYHLAPITVYTAWIDPRAFAEAGDGAITVNKRWSTGDYATLNAAIQDDIAAGYHNGGCGPIETIAIHESAHIIDQRRGFLPRQRLANAAAADDRSTLPMLAGYSFTDSGALNPGEALAEAFQAYECGTADPVEVKMYKMLVG
jgi:hypothetical protein